MIPSIIKVRVGQSLEEVDVNIASKWNSLANCANFWLRIESASILLLSAYYLISVSEYHWEREDSFDCWQLLERYFFYELKLNS